MSPVAGDRPSAWQSAEGRPPKTGETVLAEVAMALLATADDGSHGESDDVPGSLTRLVGRDRELDELARLFGDRDTRLVTLIGPGGVGKTRLAIELGRSLRGEFDEGARFVPLADLADPGLVLPTIGRALGLRDAGKRPLRQRLRDELHGRSLLLILDNFEHLLVAAEAIGEMLAECPSVTVVATSRRPLSIRGEHVVPLAPLGLPDGAERSQSPLSSPAVRLFVARAKEADASFNPDRADADAIAEICRRLDGLPLAIELAASRVRVLPPQALLARLERRLPILTGGAQDLPKRQRTLRSTIAWSYDLLSPADQAIFRRLSVFKGGFTLAAAEHVAAGPASDDDSSTVLDRLSSLADWSLLFRERVRTDDGSHLDPRYELLTTVREFGFEQLEASGEAEAIKDRHATFYTDLAREARRRLTGPDQAGWIERLEFEHDNMRSALDWLTVRGEAERALTLAADLWLFWFMRGYLAEGRRALATVLALPNGGPTPARMRALTGGGALAEAQGDDESATTLLDEAMEVGASLERADLLGIACTFRGLVAFDLNQRDGAVSFCQRGLELAESSGDAWCAGIALVQLGLVAIREHQYDRAEECLTRSLDHFRSIDHQSGIAIATGSLGILALDRRDCNRAATLLAESLTMFQAQGDRWGVASYLEAAMRAAAGRRQPALAASLAGAVEALHAGVGIVVKGIYRESYERSVTELQRELGEPAFAAAFGVGRAATPVQAVAMAVRAAESGPEGADAAKEKPAAPAAPAHGIALTTRQADVLSYLVEGMTDREIGAALFIGHRTVATHVGDLMNKMGVNSRTAVVATAVRMGLV
jgi:predicted ATPase/DNA-binding CsgD family transcriptional regulator